MIETVYLWFAFMVVMMWLNIWAMRIGFRLIHLVIMAITLLSIPAMWGEFTIAGGMLYICLGLILINAVIAVMGMVRR